MQFATYEQLKKVSRLSELFVRRSRIDPSTTVVHGLWGEATGYPDTTMRRRPRRDNLCLYVLRPSPSPPRADWISAFRADVRHLSDRHNISVRSGSFATIHRDGIDPDDAGVGDAEFERCSARTRVRIPYSIYCSTINSAVSLFGAGTDGVGDDLEGDEGRGRS